MSEPLPGTNRAITTETACPSCGKRLRVPAAKRGQATCPHCRRIFDWEPLYRESTDLAFRCAVTGEHFRITFERERRSDHLRIARVTFGDALRRSDASAGNSEPRNDRDVRNGRSYDANEISFYGFRCPLCRFQPRGSLAPFVQCSVCHEFVCCGRTTVSPEHAESPEVAVQLFRCHDGCGHSGAIGGAITAFEGTTPSVAGSARGSGIQSKPAAEPGNSVR